jgi:hypothetical protein
LLATKPLFGSANPLIAERIEKLKTQNRHYLAHEYFNRDWHPMHFASMAKWLEPAKLSYGCSAHYLDHVDNINLTDEQQAFLKDIPDAMFRQSVRDFMVNQQFRRDYWVKGARRLSSLDQVEALRAQRFILRSDRRDVSLKAMGSLGEATMNEEIYGPILDLMADLKPKSLGQLEQALRGQTNISLPHILQAATVLSGTGQFAAIQDEDVTAKARKHTVKMNAYLMDKARGSEDVNYLASPVTGGGVILERFPQLFLQAVLQGKRQPAEWAQAVWQILSMQGQKIVLEGKTLDSPEENLAELTRQALDFAERRLAVMKALSVV